MARDARPADSPLYDVVVVGSVREQLSLMGHLVPRCN